ncbi:MAG TPA: L,D-transpeptidase family protein [Vicinamibacterales bacterium]|nr:L,D-transpeptidase family protein [Vicinamibacterales bacterium]
MRLTALLLLVVVQAGPARPPDSAVAAIVAEMLASAEHPGLKWRAIPDVVAALRPLYDAEPDRLVWIDGTTPSASLDATLAALRSAGDHGLDPADYDAARLTDQLALIRLRGSAIAPQALAHFDLGVSVAAARMLRAVSLGRIDPATMRWGYDLTPKQFDVTAVIADVRRGTALAAALEELEPRFAHYTRARRTLAVYKALAAAGEPEPIPSLPRSQKKVESGQSWTGAPQLARRLQTFGDLPAGAYDGTPTYSPALVDAVRKFQTRHGLEVDGVLGPGTIAALNVTLAARVRQIELAIERMRWLPALGVRPKVFVNVPLFRLWADDPISGNEPLRMNVVVGQSMNHQTPIFVEQMEYVVFRPYWYPPYSITSREIVPKALKDPAYMDREALEIVATGDDNAASLPATPENLALVRQGKLFVRQRPGPKNSLGLAKFIFPNDDNVYMHGTPAEALFARARRDFSHGCIRLEDPARFAEWVLREQPEWTRARIDAAMQGARPARVNLKQPLAVVIFYDTVHVNSENVVFFVSDIYGHDRALDAALNRGYPYPLKSATPARR